MDYGTILVCEEGFCWWEGFCAYTLGLSEGFEEGVEGDEGVLVYKHAETIAFFWYWGDRPRTLCIYLETYKIEITIQAVLKRLKFISD